jgi:hypothetical protein
MDEDKLLDQISKGRQAATLEEPLKLAAERVKNSLRLYLMTCKEEEMPHTRRLILATDQLMLALQNVINDAKIAERELANIEQGRHRIYTIA